MLKKQLLDMLQCLLEVDPSNQDNIYDYELDSITFMQFIVQIEEKFNITIPNKFLEYGGEETLDQIEKIIIEKLDEKFVK